MKKETGAAYARAFRRATDAMALSGVVIFLTGVYYFGVNAGVPYQDPTPEMQIKYAVMVGAGSVLMKEGALMGVLGAVLKICARAVKKARLL